MTLRWRLILSSTLILGLVFAFFGIIAYFAARHSLYTPVDDNLENQMSALKLYIGKTHRLPPQLTDPD
jgi:hypothetical protein